MLIPLFYAFQFLVEKLQESGWCKRRQPAQQGQSSCPMSRKSPSGKDDVGSECSTAPSTPRDESAEAVGVKDKAA